MRLRNALLVLAVMMLCVPVQASPDAETTEVAAADSTAAAEAPAGTPATTVMADPAAATQCRGGASAAVSADDLTTAADGAEVGLGVPEPIPACSGDDCGCYDDPCDEDDCPSMSLPCLRQCHRDQVNCALCCCGGGNFC